MADIRTISQSTGQFIEDGSEPGFVVNMDDKDAQAFIDRIKAQSPQSSAAVEVAPAVETAPVQAVAEPITKPAAEAPATEPAPAKAKAPVKSTRKRK